MRVKTKFRRIDHRGNQPRISRSGVVVKLAWSSVPLALMMAGCQNSVEVQTHIPALPPLAQHRSTYVANLVYQTPSDAVDAGRDYQDPITHKTSPIFGKKTYEESCASCHGTVGKDGKLTGMMAGVPDLSDRVFTWDKTPQELFKDLLSSPAHTRDPKVSGLDRQSVWNSLYYTWTFHTALNDVVNGGILFGRYCSVCHGTKGRGDGNLAGDLNPQPRQFVDFNWMVDKTDQRLYISISDGRPPSAMPAWKASLSPTQRIQIINYIRQFAYNYPENIQKKMAEQPPPT